MKLHMLTLTWNGQEKLVKLYESLVATKVLKDFDTVWHIKDNGSKDETLKEIKKFKDVNTVVYDVGHNRDTFARGVNYLFEKASPSSDDILCLLNNDIVFNDSESLNNMHKLMQQTDSAIVGGRLLYNGTTKLQHAGVIFGERYGKMPYHFRHGEESDSNAEKNRYFQAVTAAVCIVKSKVFNDVNGMNEQFKWAFDDIDLCLRIGQKHKIAYCGKTNIYHEESASLKKNPVNKLFLDHNVKTFRDLWFGKYKLDHEVYLKNSTHNEIKV